MPTVNGKIYPVLHERFYDYSHLKILIVNNEDDYIVLKENISVLEAYLTDIDSKIKIEVASTGKIHGDRAEFLKQEDIDVLMISEGVIDADEVNKVIVRHTQVVHSLDDILIEIEAFLVGNGIFWTFSQPVWHGVSLSKYILCGGVNHIAQEFHDFIRQQDLPSKLVDRSRHLWTKVMLVSYSRDLLTHVLQSRRKSRRMGFGESQNFSTEINYHLTNLYFLMASTFDILARICNDYYSLGIKKHHELALEKKVMLESLKVRASDLYDYLIDKGNRRWILWLKQARNYVAHDGSVSHLPIVKEKAKKLTDNAANKMVDSMADWNLLLKLLPSDLYSTYRSSYVSFVRTKHDFETIAEDAMIIDDLKGTKISFPLLSIHYDYEKFSNMINELLDIIKKSLLAH